MRSAYLDCFAGIAGDMFLGALIDAGVPVEVLERAAAALGIGASLRVERVDRSGISCAKVHVLEDGQLAESAGDSHAQHHAGDHSHKHGHKHSHTHSHDHSHEHLDEHSHGDDGHTHEDAHGRGHQHTQSYKPEYAHEHGHKHEHGHAHGRSLSEIKRLIEATALHDAVKRTALRAFEMLGASEAKIHNVPVEKIHFHEVGAVDAIVDIVAACAGIHHLNVTNWYASAVNVGGGTVDCAHGTFPVPAPATADLLRGVPTYSAHVQKELVTPTGAALLRALGAEFGPQPPMSIDRIGYGAGTRNPKDFPNVLRLSVGHATDVRAANHRHPGTAHASEVVSVIETAVDDCSPQLLAHVAERALAAGALDVMLTPVIMKKGRPGTTITVLANPEDVLGVQELLLSETSTLGVRIREERRVCLQRRHETVETQYGAIRVKIGSEDGTERNAAPEFEDCRAAAEKAGVAVKQVQQAAMAAWLSSSSAAVR